MILLPLKYLDTSSSLTSFIPNNSKASIEVAKVVVFITGVGCTNENIELLTWRLNIRFSGSIGKLRIFLLSNDIFSRLFDTDAAAADDDYDDDDDDIIVLL
jgi:hypothetical protein